MPNPATYTVLHIPNRLQKYKCLIHVKGQCCEVSTIGFFIQWNPAGPSGSQAPWALETGEVLDDTKETFPRILKHF